MNNVNHIRLIGSMLILFPSSCNANPQKSEAGFSENELLDELSRLLLGNGESAPPLMDLARQQGSSGGLDHHCTNAQKLYDHARTTFPFPVSFLLNCTSAKPLGFNIDVEKINLKNPALFFTIDLTKEIHNPPLFKVPARIYQRGYFSKSRRHCQLWLNRDKVGRIYEAILRISAKGPENYSEKNREQQECLVRGILAAFGLQGASDLPFETLAYRFPWPIGMRSGITVEPSGMRIRTRNLAQIIYGAPTEEGFRRLREGPIGRRDLVAAIATYSELDKVISIFENVDRNEQADRQAKEPPKPSVGPTPIVTSGQD